MPRIAGAVAWYAANDRIRTAPDADEALHATVDAWYADVRAGRDAAMYAWRRTDVDALNRIARDRFAAEGRLTGPELVAPGGRHRVGDRIVTLAPAAEGQVVTSERGDVVSVDDLTRDWAVDRRARWAIDSGTPATEPFAVEHHDRAPAGMRAALRHARLQAEGPAVAAAIPPDPTAELTKIEQQLGSVRRDKLHLLTGQGRYVATPAGQAAHRYLHARETHSDARRHAETADSWRDRRHWGKRRSDGPTKNPPPRSTTSQLSDPR